MVQGFTKFATPQKEKRSVPQSQTSTSNATKIEADNSNKL